MKHFMIGALIWLTTACGGALQIAGPIAAADPEDVTVDYFHGDRVSDPYRWLEETGTPKTDEWLAKQAKKADAFFTGAAKVKDRLIELEKQKSPVYTQLVQVGKRLFALKTQPPLNQPLIVAMPSWEHPEQEEVVVDPNILDPTGATAVDWFVPSPNGKLLAVSLSKNDTEAGDLYIYKLEKKPAPKSAKHNKKAKGNRNAKNAPSAADAAATPEKKEEPYGKLDEVIPRVNRSVGGGSLVWTTDGKGFYYVRYPDEENPNGSLNQKVYYHNIGDMPHSDTLELGQEVERIGCVRLEIDARSNRVIATIQRGRAQSFAHYLRNPDGTWQNLSTFDDDTVEIVFAPSGGMFVITREEAKRGKVLFLPSPKVPITQAKRLIPEVNDVIVAGIRGQQAMTATKTRLYVNYLTSSGYELRIYALDGRKMDAITRPFAAVTGALVPTEREEVLVPIQAYNAPSTWWRYDGQLGAGSLTQTRLSTTGLDGSDLQVEELTALSKDGAKLPITVVHKSGVSRSGENPTLIASVGAFGAFRMPHFDSFERIWLDNGGILAYASVRGNGELGEDWHAAGRLTHKQHTFNDLYDCVRYLVKEKWTSNGKVALRGTGESALSAMVVLTQHPDAVRAATAKEGSYDMMRNEYTAGGETQVSELGTNTEETEYRAMIAYSPYHHVPQRTDLPAALIIAGRNDRCTAPWHSRKMAARLQAEQTGGGAILFRTGSDRGRGNHLPYLRQLQEEAEELYFLFRSLGVRFK